MFNKITLTLIILLLAVSTGYAFVKDSGGLTYTEKNNCYNIHFSVLPVKEQIFLQIYDGDNNPVKLINVNKLNGQVILPDGSNEKVTFNSTKALNNKHISRRGASTFVAYGDWLKDYSNFKIQVKLPLNKKQENLMMTKKEGTRLISLNFCLGS